MPESRNNRPRKYHPPAIIHSCGIVGEKDASVIWVPTTVSLLLGSRPHNFRAAQQKKTRFIGGTDAPVVHRKIVLSSLGTGSK